MSQTQITRGLGVATTFAILALLGSSCSPVSNSVPKGARSGKNQVFKNNDGSESAQIVNAEFIVSSRGFRESNYQKKLEKFPKGLKHFELNGTKIESLREDGSTLLEIPEVNGAVQIFVVIEVNANEDAIEKKKLDQVKIQWKRTELTEFRMKFVEDEKSDFVTDNLEGVTIFYRTLN